MLYKILIHSTKYELEKEMNGLSSAGWELSHFLTTTRYEMIAIMRKMTEAREEILAKLNTKIENLPWSIRAYNILYNNNIKYVGQLASLHEYEVLKWEETGRKHLNEFKKILAEQFDLKLGYYLYDWKAPEY